MKDYLDVLYDKKRKPKSSYPEKLVNYLLSLGNILPGQKLLDVGIGDGTHAKLFKQKGLDVYGVDVSEKAKEKSPEINIVTTKLGDYTLPFQDDEFDIVYSKSFVEHIREPAKYFLEANRVLKPGGIIITLTPDWERNFKKFFDDPTHVSPFSIYTLRDHQLMSGFEIILLRKFKQLPSSWNSNFLNNLYSIIGFISPVRAKIKIFRWSRELMLLSIAKKP